MKRNAWIYGLLIVLYVSLLSFFIYERYSGPDVHHDMIWAEQFMTFVVS